MIHHLCELASLQHMDKKNEKLITLMLSILYFVKITLKSKFHKMLTDPNSL